MTHDMPEEQVSLFSGEPYTVIGHDADGRSTARIRIQALTPERVGLCQLYAALTILAIILLCVASGNPHLSLGSFLLIFAHGVITQEFAYKLTPVTNVQFTPAEFKVERDGRWYVYNRTIKHSFALIEHDKAQDERERHQHQIAQAQLRREAIRPRKMFSQSFHLVYMYFGQRHDITSIYGEKMANTIVARLQACDALMDAQLKMGDAPVSDPGEQWDAQQGDAPQAGDLP